MLFFAYDLCPNYICGTHSSPIENICNVEASKCMERKDGYIGNFYNHFDLPSSFSFFWKLCYLLADHTAIFWDKWKSFHDALPSPAAFPVN